MPRDIEGKQAGAGAQGPAIAASLAQSSPGALLRDQHRALHAYGAVGRLPNDSRRDYKIAVNDLGADILRAGLAAAMAALERLGEKGRPLLQHLAAANIPGLEGATADDLPRLVRSLELDEYILATRETLQVAKWLKRAVQATSKDDENA